MTADPAASPSSSAQKTAFSLRTLSPATKCAAALTVALLLALGVVIYLTAALSAAREQATTARQDALNARAERKADLQNATRERATLDAKLEEARRKEKDLADSISSQQTRLLEMEQKYSTAEAARRTAEEQRKTFQTNIEKSMSDTQQANAALIETLKKTVKTKDEELAALQAKLKELEENGGRRRR